MTWRAISTRPYHERALELDGRDLGVVGGVDGAKTRAQRVLGFSHHALHGLVFREPEGSHGDIAGSGPGELRAVQPCEYGLVIATELATVIAHSECAGESVRL